MIGAMGVLYARLLGQSPDSYLPYLAVGVVLWTFMSTSANELCLAFIGAENLVKQVKLPLTVHVTRVVWRNLLILFHNAVILVPIAIFYGRSGPLALVSAVFGVALLAISAICMGLILGTLCARFRDIPPIVQNLIQIVFFLSPILWRPEVLGDRIWVAHVNPIFHFIEIVRAPLTADTIPATSWAVAGMVFLMLATASFLLLIKFRARVAYWV
jgi:lipopolysaccharide transport system permease protein